MVVRSREERIPQRTVAQRSTPSLGVNVALIGAAVIALGVFLSAVVLVALGHRGAQWFLVRSGLVLIAVQLVMVLVTAFRVIPQQRAALAQRAMVFRDTVVEAEARYSLGVVEDTGGHYLAIPVSNGVVDYGEYYSLSAGEYTALSRDRAAAARLADRCRRRELDDRLLQAPGPHRGIPT